MTSKTRKVLNFMGSETYEKMLLTWICFYTLVIWY